MAQAIKSNKIK